MTFKLRDYQRDCVDGLYQYWAEEGGNPLLVVPTGGGKSGIAGTIKRELFDKYGDMRIINVTHVAELVDQNYKELIGMWEWAPAGVYSAGLGRRELASQILFAGIQSIHTKAHLLGQVDLLMVDEAHLIPRKADTMYGRFIAAVRERNPDMRLIGLTATPYRTDSGRLDEGDDKLFDAVAYDIDVGYLIDQGWLAPVTTKATATVLKTDGVAKRGGDFVPGALQAAIDKEEITRAVCEEIEALGQDRRSWLVFCPGVENAQHFHAELAGRGYTGGVITGDTDPSTRARLIADFKAYRIRYLVNCGVLTTGFNHPGVDLLAMVRPTESTGLYIQMVGRGTRAVYAPGFNPNTATAEERRASIAASTKPNCLVLDFARNISRHGPIDKVKPKKPGKGGGEAPVKVCPQCFSMVHASVMECPDCGHTWERNLSDKITKTAATAPILSKIEPEWVKVQQRTFHRHEKFGAPPSVRVEYRCGLVQHREWIPFENPKTAGLASSFWRQAGGDGATPKTVSEALQRVSELRPIDEIRIEPDGKYWRITGRRYGERGAAPAPAPAPSWEFDEEIPF